MLEPETSNYALIAAMRFYLDLTVTARSIFAKQSQEEADKTAR